MAVVKFMLHVDIVICGPVGYRGHYFQGMSSLNIFLVIQPDSRETTGQLAHTCMVYSVTSCICDLHNVRGSV